jgi:hypothetical protein
MPNRTAKFVSAILASLLAGAALTAVSDNAANADDSCVSGPQGAPPPGGHWYYRIDRPTKRHCWYVRDENGNLSQAAPQDSPAPASPVSPQQQAATPQSIADARAEMPMPQTSIAQDTDATPAQRIPATEAGAATTDQGTNAPDAGVSVVASRWPDPSAVSSSTSTTSTGPMPATGNSVANLSVANAQSNRSNPTAAADAAVTFVAADSSPAKQPSSFPKLLTVIVGALSVVAVMGGSVFRFGGARPIAIDRRSAPIYPNSGAGFERADFRRRSRTADDPSRKIEEMLAQLSRTRSAPG